MVYYGNDRFRQSPFGKVAKAVVAGNAVYYGNKMVRGGVKRASDWWSGKKGKGDTRSSYRGYQVSRKYIQNVVKGMKEPKHVDDTSWTNIATLTYSNQANSIALDTIATGDNNTQRIGDRVTVKSVYIRGQCAIRNADRATYAYPFGAIVNLYLVWCSEASFDAADFPKGMEVRDYDAFVTKKYKILGTKRYQLCDQGDYFSSAGTFRQAKVFSFSWFTNLDQQLIYASDAVTSPMNGRLILVANLSGTDPTDNMTASLAGTARTTFVDY